jgi:hypothetical protein
MATMGASLVDSPVALSVYWQRPVAFDEQGRVQRSWHGGSQLSWHQKLVKDILGIYHVGVVAYGVEYAFGNSHAPYSRRLGGEAGGVVAHRPGEAGPQNVLKETVEMGTTCLTIDQVELIAKQLSSASYQRHSYQRLQHNCVDFAQGFCACLGVAGELPAWCHRAASTARLMGFGAAEANSASTPAVPSMKSGGCTLSFSALPTTMLRRIRADSSLSDVSTPENDARGRVDLALSDMSIHGETSHGERSCRHSVWREIKDRMAKNHPSTDGLCSPISISELSLAPFVDAAPPRIRGDSALDNDSEIVTPKTPQTPWSNPQFKMGQEFTVDHGREQDTQDSDSGRSTDCASQGSDMHSIASLSARSGDDESLPDIWTC